MLKLETTCPYLHHRTHVLQQPRSIAIQPFQTTNMDPEVIRAIIVILRHSGHDADSEADLHGL
jgi:hypothetical protein